MEAEIEGSGATKGVVLTYHVKGIGDESKGVDGITCRFGELEELGVTQEAESARDTHQCSIPARRRPSQSPAG